MANLVFQPPTATYPVDCVHLVEYFSKGIDNEGPFYDVKYYTETWANTDLLVNFLLGFRSLSGGTSGQLVTRAPHQHPLSPNLYCKEAIVEMGLGGPVINTNGFPAYQDGAVLKATYRPWVASPVEMTPQELENQIDPDTPILWCTQELEGTVEAFSVPALSLIWSDTSAPTNQPFRLYVPVQSMTLTFHKTPYLPTSILRNYRGRVNSATFLGASAGLVLFKGYKTSREANTDGTVSQQITLSFMERDSAAPWNSLPRVNASGAIEWQQVKLAGSGTTAGGMYPTSDLNGMLIF